MYRIIGADQREYGPVSPDQVRQWIAAHRADKDTQIRAEGAFEWKRLEELPEFADALSRVHALPAEAAPPALAQIPATKQTPTSGLAIASLVLGVLGILSCGITALVGLALGIVALVRINRSRGAQKGQGVAIAGVVVSAVFLLVLPVGAALLLPALAKAKSRAQNISCMSNLKQLALGAIMYANDQKDTLPPADRWGDALQKYVGSEAPFRCLSGAPEHRCHYGYNARLAGAELATLKNPAQTVLFFEIEGGWNVSGGPEAMLSKSRHGKTFTVAFLDGHCESVGEARARQLQWEP